MTNLSVNESGSSSTVSGIDNSLKSTVPDPAFQNIMTRVGKAALLAVVGSSLAMIGYGLYTAGRALAYIPGRVRGVDIKVTEPIRKVFSEICDNFKFLYYRYQPGEISKTFTVSDNVIRRLEQTHKISDGSTVIESLD